MNYSAFYRQINKADDRLIEISRAFNDLRLRTEDFSSCLDELARDAEKIKDEEERERFNNVLAYFSERLYEISEQCDDLSGELNEVHHCDFNKILVKAEGMAMEEKKNR